MSASEADAGNFQSTVMLMLALLCSGDVRVHFCPQLDAKTLTVLGAAERMLCRARRPVSGAMVAMPLRCMRASTAVEAATMPTPLQAPHWMLRTGRPAAAPPQHGKEPLQAGMRCMMKLLLRVIQHCIKGIKFYHRRGSKDAYHACCAVRRCCPAPH